MIGTLFPYAIAVLQVGASIVYLSQGRMRLGIYWLCCAGAVFAIAGQK